MYPSIIATAVIALAPAVLGFKNTSPLLIYSLVPTADGEDTIRQVGSSISKSEDVYRSIASIGCSWETMAVGRVDGLHHSHIPSFSLAPESIIMNVPYLLNPSISSLDSAVEDLAQICGADIVDSLSGAVGAKEIVLIDGKKGDDIASIVANLDVQPNLVIFTGTPSSTPSKRQEDEDEVPFPDISSEDPTYSYQSDPETPYETQTPEYPSEPSEPTDPSEPEDDTEPPSSSNRTSTIPPKSAPLLQRVQLLTTPLIASLLIGFFVFIPIVSFGVSALVGIQVPPRMLEISKSMVVGKDKKDQ